MHCRPPQQRKIAQICREYLGDILVTGDSGEFTSEEFSSISPSQLMRRVLVKGKVVPLAPSSMDSTQNVCRQLSRRLSTQLIGPELRSAMSALNVSKCGMSSSGKAGWDRRDSDIEGLDDDLEEMKHEAIARCALLLASRRRNGSVRRLSPLPVVMSSLPLDEDLRGVVNTGADTSRRRGKRVKKK
eukprot:4254935-Prymnesium_polylepis.1